MHSANKLQKYTKLTLAILTFGMTIGLLPALAENPIAQPKPFITSTGTAGDLGGIQGKTSAEWLGGVGGEYEARVINQSVSEQRTSPFIERTVRINRDWNNAEEMIDTDAEPLSTFRVPFTQF
ncbi:MAG: hypothetical protein MUD14_06220 [Hydrococcus sp. Prado102]|jgi:hypothetical protein|nr:hypothetical protein [Hydrococcus sp. Prado102]